MAGIYLHVPFCHKACHYCDFHFSTSLRLKEELVAMMARELELQRDYLPSRKLDTIYFGGGTPSILTEGELGLLLERMHALFDTAAVTEVTLEANPEDLTPEKLQAWKRLGVNRLSVGIQTFDTALLQALNRAHSGEQALQGVRLAQELGFENISVDLIYALPGGGHALWERDIEQALSLQVPHISSYCLTIEERTAFGVWARKGKLQEQEEDYAARQYEYLMERLEKAGYEHYEISNFALPGRYSRHNTSYWQQEPYLGIGPGAHSFNGRNRQYNKPHNPQYVRSLQQGQVPFELDILSDVDRANEYVMTTLRTQWGCDLAWLRRELGIDLQTAHGDALIRFQGLGWIEQQGSLLRLSRAGKLFADKIAAELFV